MVRVRVDSIKTLQLATMLTLELGQLYMTQTFIAQTGKIEKNALLTSKEQKQHLSLLEIMYSLEHDAL